ncbi:hypothetical protein B7463_g952, partial [Scytalidium lignicola]
MAAPQMPLPPSLQESVDNSKVEYVNLGKSGLRVSVPILGAMSIGHPDWAPWVLDEEKSLPILKAAYDRGLNTWDTANVYSNGASEEIIGKAIKKYNIPRHKLVILSKCYGTVGEEPGIRHIFYPKQMRASKDYVNQGGLSRQAIFNAVEASLKRLDTPYLDLLQIHRFDPTTPIEETMEALHDLVKSGKVRYIGASSMWATQFAQLQFVAEKNGWTKFISMQNQYNLIYREEEREMIRFCNSTGVGLIPWAPLARGNLARPYEVFGSTIRSKPEKEAGGLTEIDAKIIQRVQELAEKKGWKMTHVALAWINKRVSSPIVGFSSVARLDEAIEARGKTLTDEEEEYLEELFVFLADTLAAAFGGLSASTVCLAHHSGVVGHLLGDEVSITPSSSTRTMSADAAPTPLSKVDSAVQGLSSSPPKKDEAKRRASSSVPGVYNIADLEKEGKEIQIAKETQRLNWRINKSPQTLEEPEKGYLKKLLTEPPIKKIDLHFPLGLEVTARNLKGVTIKDALDAIYKQFRKKADDELETPVLAGFEWDKEECWTRFIVHCKKEGAPQPKKKSKKGAEPEDL